MGKQNRSENAHQIPSQGEEPSRQPLVSIGLPVYNSSRWIENSIRSFLSQSYQNFELIISDNFSTDSTPSICERFAAEDSRIRYSRNETNIGLIPNHNLVVKYARGEYFIWGSYDDLHHPDSISSMVHAMQSRPELVLVYTRAESIDECDRISTENDVPVQLDEDRAGNRARALLSDFPPTETIFYGLMRRSAMLKTRLLPNCHGSDFIFLLQLVTLGKMSKIPTVLFYRRVHSNNVVTSQEHPWRFRADWSGKLIFPQWRILLENTKSTLRAELPIDEKLELLASVFHFSWKRRSLLKSELGFAWYYTKQRLRGKNPTLSSADSEQRRGRIQTNGLTF